MTVKLTIDNMRTASLHELIRELSVDVDACYEQINGILESSLTVPIHPVTAEAFRQQLVVDEYKTKIVILTNSEEAAVNLVDLALAFARTTAERNETVFVSVMDDVLTRLARGDYVADVTEWISGLQPDN